MNLWTSADSNGLFIVGLILNAGIFALMQKLVARNGFDKLGFESLILTLIVWNVVSGSRYFFMLIIKEDTR